jgi:hypothetical protein
MPVNPFFDHYQHLKTFPDSVLRDLARNEAAPRDYRKFAVELLLNRRSPYARHTDLQEFVAQLEVEFDGIVFDHPAPETAPTTGGALKASVTTATMFSDGPIDNGFTGFDDVQITDEKPARKKPKKKEPDAP